jgi:hypothetical protein
MAQLWHDLAPTAAGGLAGILGVLFAEAFLVSQRQRLARIFKR